LAVLYQIVTCIYTVKHSADNHEKAHSIRFITAQHNTSNLNCTKEYHVYETSCNTQTLQQ